MFGCPLVQLLTGGQLVTALACESKVNENADFKLESDGVLALYTQNYSRKYEIFM